VFPVAQLPAEKAKQLRGLVMDLDDTVLDHGRLLPNALSAMYDAKQAGLSLLVATGRAAGWGEVLIRLLPLDGMITENGSVAFTCDSGGVHRHERVNSEQRRQRRIRLASLVSDLQATFPEARLADDVDLRYSDIAFDVGEHQRVPKEIVQQMRAFAEERGARTTVSSVHFHCSFEWDDKASGTLFFLSKQRQVDPSYALTRYAFVGDSSNDAAGFAAFRTSFAVANVRPYLSGLSIPPTYIATQERAAGFHEIIQELIEKRR
jgi:hydroxymethylpyrimidine pyrophosphatase-like HAD family hydrolase